MGSDESLPQAIHVEREQLKDWGEGCEKNFILIFG